MVKIQKLTSIAIILMFMPLLSFAQEDKVKTVLTQYLSYLEQGRSLDSYKLLSSEDKELMTYEAFKQIVIAGQRMSHLSFFEVRSITFESDYLANAVVRMITVDFYTLIATGVIETMPSSINPYQEGSSLADFSQEFLESLPSSFPKNKAETLAAIEQKKLPSVELDLPYKAIKEKNEWKVLLDLKQANEEMEAINRMLKELE